MQEIPQSVLQFLGERIATVPQLEALLLLWQHAARNWSAPEISSRIYVSERKAQDLLQALVRSELARTTPGEPVRFRYDGRWDASGERIAELASVYARNLVQVATFIHSRPAAGLRAPARDVEPAAE